MWVRQQPMLKPNNYTESCMINEADGWRGRNVWYLGRSVRHALKEVTIAYDGFHLAFLLYPPHSYVCNLHTHLPLPSVL